MKYIMKTLCVICCFFSIGCDQVTIEISFDERKADEIKKQIQKSFENIQAKMNVGKKESKEKKRGLHVQVGVKKDIKKQSTETPEFKLDPKTKELIKLVLKANGYTGEEIQYELGLLLYKSFCPELLKLCLELFAEKEETLINEKKFKERISRRAWAAVIKTMFKLPEGTPYPLKLTTKFLIKELVKKMPHEWHQLCLAGRDELFLVEGEKISLRQKYRNKKIEAKLPIFKKYMNKVYEELKGTLIKKIITS